MITYVVTMTAKPKEKDYTLSDGNGLYLRVWLFKKSINGKIQKKTLGRFPEVGISEARFTVKALTQAEIERLNIAQSSLEQERSN